MRRQTATNKSPFLDPPYLIGNMTPLVLSGLAVRNVDASVLLLQSIFVSYTGLYFWPDNSPPIPQLPVENQY